MNDPRLLVRVGSLAGYWELGGGDGLAAANEMAPDEVIARIEASGLRGRGGAGFPTATKWRTVLDAPGPRHVVCNAAEGEPATFKDRALMRHNPYAVIEGVAIAARALGVDEAIIGTKTGYTREIRALSQALAEMVADGTLGDLRIDIVTGPDRYLLGEETGLLAVIEGREPLPREIRPFALGLFGSASAPHPTLVNNVETLANVPAIVARGPEWFRAIGTEGSPGSMLITIAGDVVREGVFEVPLGTPLNSVIDEHAGGSLSPIKAVLAGASSAVLTPDMLGLPLDFDRFREQGTGLGSGGFAVYDDTVCMAEVARQFSRFLHVESCGQCPACKLQSGAINETFTALHAALPHKDMDDIATRARKVTDGQKCALPTGTRMLTLSLLDAFAAEFDGHTAEDCPMTRDLVFPKIADWDEESGRFSYDESYGTTTPQWSTDPGTTSFET